MKRRNAPFTIIAVFVLVFTLIPYMPGATSLAQALADDEVMPLVFTTDVHSLGQLVKTLNDTQITDNDFVLTITGSFDIDTTVSIPNGKTVKLTSATSTRTLQRAAGFTDSLFSVEDGSSLTIENIRLDGMHNSPGTVVASAPLITVAAGCTLNLNAGVQLEQNNNTNTTQAESGGAINNAGTTTIAGATIDLNTANYGGGIYNSGTLILRDDTVITDNIALVYGGGVYNTGTVSIESTVPANSCEITANNTASGLGAEIYDDGAITVSGTVKIGLRENNGGIYLLPTRTLNVAAAGLAQDAMIFIEALDSSETEAGRVVATRADGSAATTAEALLFAYLPDTYSVAALDGTSDYILAAPAPITPTPAEPSTPAGTESANASSASPQTGDSTSLILPVVLGVLALAALGATAALRMQKRRKNSAG